MTPQELVSLALKVSIVLIVFGFGLQATTSDLLYLWRRPGVLVRSLIAMFLVMPAFAIWLTTAFHFQRPVMIALIALAISPVPPVLLRKVHKAGGEASYELGLMVTAAALSIVYIPLAVRLIGHYFHLPFAMRPAEVAKLAGLSVILPLAVGAAFAQVAPAVAARIAKPVAILATVLLILGLAATLLFALPKSLSLIGDGTLWAFSAFVAVGLAVGHLLGGPASDNRIALALSTACRHPGLALALASANIPQQHGEFSAILLYLVINALLTGAYVLWRRRRASVHATQS